MSPTVSIARNQVRLLLSDPGPIVQYLIIPLVLIALLKPSQGTILQQQGFQEANGSEQVVPGVTAWFTFFWMRTIGDLFFQQHGWGTWERLQSSFASSAQIVVGMLAPLFVVIALQHLILFGAGALLFDLSVSGSLLGLALVFLCLNLSVLALSLMLVAICGSMEQIEALGTMLTMLFATIGGAMVPSFILPSLAEDVAPATPVYWAVEASREVILEGEGISGVLGQCGALLGFFAVFALIAATRFRMGDVKTVEAG
jgi:ABC-2 type transport system permease protein